MAEAEKADRAGRAPESGTDGGQEKRKAFSLPLLFFSMMEISAFTFGGGFVIISMMRKKFCSDWHWVTDEEVLDMTAIAESAPGALAVNSAIIFGYRLAGVPGSLIAAAGTVIPPIAIISVISLFYRAFSANAAVQTALQVMRAGVAAIIADVTIDLFQDLKRAGSWLNIALMAAAFAASWIFSVTPIVIILLFIAFGLAKDALQCRNERKGGPA